MTFIKMALRNSPKPAQARIPAGCGAEMASHFPAIRKSANAKAPTTRTEKPLPSQPSRKTATKVKAEWMRRMANVASGAGSTPSHRIESKFDLSMAKLHDAKIAESSSTERQKGAKAASPAHRALGRSDRQNCFSIKRGSRH
ncbi:MAG: hypothetical protein IPL47_16675 [Phyllobacteriaceae bacterium]|nr:hypothetical protein [Phyllobacteriaceae bacterium]